MKHNKNTTLLVFLLHFRFFNILYCQNRLIQNKNRNFVAQVRCRKALTANLENEINLTHKIKYQTIMKKYVAIALSLFTAIAFTSCKSQESAYKKAYEKAKQQQTVEQQQPQQTTVAVQPTQPATTVTTTPAPTHADANVRSESVQLIDGAGLKTYSVVCGSFSLKANNAVFDGYTFAKAYYLYPVPIRQMELLSPDRSVNNSVLYQNPYWPSKTSEPAIE